jgi:hypothetical protein
VDSVAKPFRVLIADGYGQFYQGSLYSAANPCTAGLLTQLGSPLKCGPGWTAEHRIAYRPKGAWQVGWERGLAAARRSHTVRESALAAAPVAVAQTRAAAVPAAVGCDVVFNAAFNQAFNTGFNSGYNSAYKSAFNQGYKAGFAKGKRGL